MLQVNKPDMLKYKVSFKNDAFNLGYVCARAFEIVSLDHYRPPLLFETHPHAHPDQDSSSKGVVGNERKWTGLQVHHLHQDL